MLICGAKMLQLEGQLEYWLTFAAFSLIFWV
jgi:hypothetical protein